MSIYTVTTSIFVTTSFVGFHRWPNASKILPDRAYLENLHRHIFNVRIELPVYHQDREVEYHDLKDNLDAFITLEHAGNNWPEAMSCEAMAEKIIQWLASSYKDRAFYRVTVDEDGENGSTLMWTLDLD